MWGLAVRGLRVWEGVLEIFRRGCEHSEIGEEDEPDDTEWTIALFADDDIGKLPQFFWCRFVLKFLGFLGLALAMYK